MEERGSADNLGSMSEANLNTDKVAARARALIETDVSARVAAVTAIAVAANEYDAADARLKEAIKTAEARLKEAGNTHATAWKSALSAGWSEKSLRATGVRAPGQSVPKVRKTRAAAAKAAAATPTPHD
ncbi:hypothetical protein [Cryobacterium sp. TMT3-29-2]|uniref:hypothetical protein n=1 Tax=Cryobacterium sp. TMT3-29-2 TaxID=2555867 RepID=UPI0010730328|nr:hypothetical protein [Cryobacterium sp. TMT3-29-2]TFC83024.1 hypothetical protein E3O67_15360 [Cryobacterium sp. TMT3-29-2]